VSTVRPLWLYFDIVDSAPNVSELYLSVSHGYQFKVAATHRERIGIWIAALAVAGDFNIGAGISRLLLSVGSGDQGMDGNYMFLCGVMWCKFGQQEAGKELLRAANSGDADVSALAWAMLAKGARRLRDMGRQAQPSPRRVVEGSLCG
jgi:hypothetical protein